MNLPKGERFDASGLLLRRKGELLAVNDREAAVYRIDFLSATNADLVRLPDCFTTGQLASFQPEKIGRWDCEGITEDSEHRLYLCEEGNRWILRFDPKNKTVERLAINWSPYEKYFHPTEHNAAFEGIAIGSDRLYVANERQIGRIFVVDLNTLKVVDDFTVRPSNTNARETHYSDLCWFEDSLFALLRENHVVVKIDPTTHRVLAEYDFAKIGRDRESAYKKLYPTGNMEGLAVDEKNIWLVTDNNGLGRKKFPQDTRPTLFKCPRPDR